MATTNTQVIVKRSKWYRGKGSEDSYLLLRGGKMCCIGFLARAFGCTRKDILLKNVIEYVPSQESWSLTHDRTLSKCYDINDDDTITEAKRERELKALGKKMGVQFTFVD